MKVKKYLGNLILLLTAVLVNAGTASIAAVGTEEMPDSIKNLR